MEQRGAGVRDRLAAAVPAAMRARDRDRLRVLRSTLAAIANAEAVPTGDHAPSWSARGAGSTDAPRRGLGELETLALVRAEVDELDRAAATYDDLGRSERATSARHGAALLRELLG